jgi:hypothetical protein
MLSAAYLEVYGLRRLKEFFTLQDKKLFDEDIERLNFEQIALLLYALGIIDRHSFHQMCKLRGICATVVRHNSRVLPWQRRSCRRLIRDALKLLHEWSREDVSRADRASIA